MELLVLVLVLVLVLPRSQAQNLTRVRAELGQNATLTCSLRDRNIIWYQSGLRTFIGKTFSSRPYYSSPDLESKFEILENNLTIKNVTAEDRRLYFCGQKIRGEFELVESFLLVSDVPPVLPPDVPPVLPPDVPPVLPPDVPSPLPPDVPPVLPPDVPSQLQPAVWGSLSLSAVLLLLLTGLAGAGLVRRGGGPDSRPNPNPNPNPERMSSPQGGVLLPDQSQCVYRLDRTRT
ncbi:uncharacterized protein ACNS7B_017050 isoform 3-T3 [Menidia menidia]